MDAQGLERTQPKFGRPKAMGSAVHRVRLDSRQGDYRALCNRTIKLPVIYSLEQEPTINWARLCATCKVKHRKLTPAQLAKLREEYPFIKEAKSTEWHLRDGAKMDPEAVPTGDITLCGFLITEARFSAVPTDRVCPKCLDIKKRMASLYIKDKPG